MGAHKRVKGWPIKRQTRICPINVLLGNERVFAILAPTRLILSLHFVDSAQSADDINRFLLLATLLLSPVIAKAPLFNFRVLFNQVDLPDFLAPFRPDAHEFVIAAGHESIGRLIYTSNVVDSAFVSVLDRLDLHATAGENKLRLHTLLGNLKLGDCHAASFCLHPARWHEANL